LHSNGIQPYVTDLHETLNNKYQHDVKRGFVFFAQNGYDITH